MNTRSAIHLAGRLFVLLALLCLGKSVASAHEIPKPCDFVTGGGFVLTNTGQHANFGLVAGCKHHAFWGNINFIDHGTKMHLNAHDVLSYTTIIGQALRRDFCGYATVGGKKVGYHVVVIDNGEPGRNDKFGLSLSNGYFLKTRLLKGGNIQLHKPNPSTTPPAHFTECNKFAPNPTAG